MAHQCPKPSVSLSPGSLEQPYRLLLLLLLLVVVWGLLVFMRLFTQNPPNVTHDRGIFAVFCFLFQRRLKAKKHKRLHKKLKLLSTQQTFAAKVCKRYCNPSTGIFIVRVICLCTPWLHTLVIQGRRYGYMKVTAVRVNSSTLGSCWRAVVAIQKPFFNYNSLCRLVAVPRKMANSHLYDEEISTIIVFTKVMRSHALRNPFQLQRVCQRM